MIKKFEEYIESGLNEVISSNNIGGDELLEMAIMNRKDNNGVFPNSIAKIELRSNDHPNPPHVHIVWDNNDVRYSIETGDFVSIKFGKPTESDINKMEERLKEWFPLQTKLRSEKKTNQKELFDLWVLWHDEDDFTQEFILKMRK